jgi:anti-anti-sigma regulatory factor
VEFTQTSFIDSTVVAALVRRSLGGETLLLVVPRGGGAVRRTLDLIGIPDLLRTFETRDEALQAVPPEDAPPA